MFEVEQPHLVAGIHVEVAPAHVAVEEAHATSRNGRVTTGEEPVADLPDSNPVDPGRGAAREPDQVGQGGADRVQHLARAVAGDGVADGDGEDDAAMTASGWAWVDRDRLEDVVAQSPDLLRPLQVAERGGARDAAVGVAVLSDVQRAGRGLELVDLLPAIGVDGPQFVLSAGPRQSEATSALVMVHLMRAEM
jgi:hypothetical protein